jgi:hypothetical protein
MKVKKKDLLKFSEISKIFEGTKYSTKFSYFLIKNKLVCKDEIDALEEVRNPDQKFLDFEVERVKAAQEYSEKNPDGTPVINNNSFVIKADNQSKFNDQMNVLKNTYKDAIKDREKQGKEFEKLLEEETEFCGSKINLSELPSQIEPVFIEILMALDLIIED